LCVGKVQAKIQVKAWDKHMQIAMEVLWMGLMIMSRF